MWGLGPRRHMLEAATRRYESVRQDKVMKSEAGTGVLRSDVYPRPYKKVNAESEAAVTE